jgi:hypothetical protein
MIKRTFVGKMAKLLRKMRVIIIICIKVQFKRLFREENQIFDLKRKETFLTFWWRTNKF